MRTKNFLTIIALFTLMLVPSVTYSAFAPGQPINWDREDYIVESYTQLGAYEYDLAPEAGWLPIWVEAEGVSLDQYEYGNSEINADIYGSITDRVNMYTDAYAENFVSDNSTSAMSTARAVFDGQFTAPASATNLIIDYDIDVSNAYVEGFDGFAHSYQHTYVSFVISGGEYSSPTYYYPLAADGYTITEVYGIDNAYGMDWDAATYYIPITPGNTYDISAYSVQRAWVEGNATSEGSAALTYSMSVETAVVPEPISSALFLAGAATLGISGYRKKKRVS